MSAEKPTGIEQIELEMAYTTWEQSCKDPVIDPYGDLRECRRDKRHVGPHASGFIKQDSFYMWGNTLGGPKHD